MSKPSRFAQDTAAQLMPLAQQAVATIHAAAATRASMGPKGRWSGHQTLAEAKLRADVTAVCTQIAQALNALLPPFAAASLHIQIATDTKMRSLSVTSVPKSVKHLGKGAQIAVSHLLPMCGAVATLLERSHTRPTSMPNHATAFVLFSPVRASHAIFEPYHGRTPAEAYALSFLRDGWPWFHTWTRDAGTWDDGVQEAKRKLRTGFIASPLAQHCIDIGTDAHALMNVAARWVAMHGQTALAERLAVAENALHHAATLARTPAKPKGVFAVHQHPDGWACFEAKGPAHALATAIAKRVGVGNIPENTRAWTVHAVAHQAITTDQEPVST